MIANASRRFFKTYVLYEISWYGSFVSSNRCFSRLQTLGCMRVLSNRRVIDNYNAILLLLRRGDGPNTVAFISSWTTQKSCKTSKEPHQLAAKRASR